MRNTFQKGVSHSILPEMRKRLGDAVPPSKK